MSRKRRIPEDTADYARWLADGIEERGEKVTTRLSPAAAWFVAMALRSYARLLDGREAAQMNFTVCDRDGRHVELLAACKAPEIAWAAYHLAIAARPDHCIILRHGDRIIDQHGEARGVEPLSLALSANGNEQKGTACIAPDCES